MWRGEGQQGDEDERCGEGRGNKEMRMRGVARGGATQG